MEKYTESQEDTELLNNFGIENPGIVSTDLRIKQRNIFFKHYYSRIKKQKVFIRKNQR